MQYKGRFQKFCSIDNIQNLQLLQPIRNSLHTEMGTFPVEEGMVSAGGEWELVDLGVESVVEDKVFVGGALEPVVVLE